MSEEDKNRLTVEEHPSGIRGVITIDENVVSTIAGLAARDVAGIYEVGKTRLISFGGSSPTRGVHAEVGSKQAAFDLDIVIEYGADIQQVAHQLRTKTAAEVGRMAGREVVEININVVDVHLPTTNDTKAKHSRVV